MPTTQAPDERVLSTLNRDGSRRWIRPKVSKGRFHRRRAIVGWSLIALFTALPYIRINGMPAVLIDIVHRKFTLFGYTFLATDTKMLMLVALSVIVTIVLFTSAFGRVWCGWGCPQTVYLEFLYRPIERWLEGSHRKQQKLDREGPNWRRIVKYGLYIVPSLFLTHIFLAYFIGIEELWRWVRSSPLEHPTAFIVMAIVTCAMYFDFTYFREQVCVVMCPYGRLQSVLLDKNSLVVGYDPTRGEPRGKKRDPNAGDCVDCSNCVTTCPTGIDIRDGLQMECVNCTQCIDACDAVMDKLGRPRGLIRYASQNQLEGEKPKWIRPRTIVYSLFLVAAATAFVTLLATRKTADVVVLRAKASPYTVDDAGMVRNRIRVKIQNRDTVGRDYTMALEGIEGATIVTAQNPLHVAVGEMETAGLFVNAPRGVFQNGSCEVTIRVTDGAGFDARQKYRLLGPWGPGETK